MEIPDPERRRLAETEAKAKHWRRWGPYLSERQWGTVREDYSADGDAWNYVSFEMSSAYTYRWGEDGLGGISDNHQRLCFAPALWNGRDPILKERLFGLTNPQGNHGEDVKEYYWYLDSTPTHSYMKMLYRYPQAEFPYRRLLAENARRTRRQREFELIDTGVLEGSRFFDLEVEYAKADVDDVLIRFTVTNRGPEAAALWLLPTLWFRNDWSWVEDSVKPALRLEPGGVRALHPTLGERVLAWEGDPELLFTENETNLQKLYGRPNASPRVKDAFHRYLIGGERDAVGREQGTKFACSYHWTLEAGGSRTVRLRLTDQRDQLPLEPEAVDAVFQQRREEADRFYETLEPAQLPEDCRRVQRQAFAGLLWSKQWYHYVVERWLKGDPDMPSPPPERWEGRNANWLHLYNDDVLVMPDKWEYPWYAVWDSAFHTLCQSLVDPELAKRQLVRFTREWYMHPNGQLPAYEWSLGDVNPPVHAWAAYRIYKIEEKHWGRPDLLFLERVFHKLLMNFTWWVNRKDQAGHNLFEGGFLGMDNIGVFDRSRPVPIGGTLLQSDSTSWMAMYCLNMLRIAWELAVHQPAYQDIASKFYEHFLYIATAMAQGSEDSPPLWNEEDGFFYDHLVFPDGRRIPLKVRSMVGLVPLFAVEVLDYRKLEQLSGFKRRMEWFEQNRPDLAANVCSMREPEQSPLCLLSVMQPEQLSRVLEKMLDEQEFLSEYGIRSLSRYHAEHPYRLDGDDDSHVVHYEPGESSSGLFGGNSNWRGPVWFPMNILIIEALQKYHYFWGDKLTVEFPTGSGRKMDLCQVADELSLRLVRIFERRQGRRPVFGSNRLFQEDPLWKDHLLFYEYFHGETGEGLGASHQTGWTSLVAKLIFQQGG